MDNLHNDKLPLYRPFLEVTTITHVLRLHTAPYVASLGFWNVLLYGNAKCVSLINMIQALKLINIHE